MTTKYFSTIRARAIALGAIALLFLAAVFLSLVLLQHETVAASAAAQKDSKIQFLIDDYEGAMAQVAASAGAAIYQDRQAYPEFRAQRADVLKAFSAVRILIHDRPVELRRLRALTSAVGRRLAALGGFIEFGRHHDANSTALFVAKQEKALPSEAEIRALQMTFERSSRDTLLARMTQQQNLQRSIVSFSMVATTVGVLLTLALCAAYGLGIVRRIELLARSARSYAMNGEFDELVGGADELTDLQDAYRNMAIAIRLHEGQLGQYRLLAEQLADIVLFVHTETGKILEANSAASAAYGCSESELLTMSVYNLLSDATCLDFGNRILAGNDDDVRFEGDHLRRNGDLFPVEMAAKKTETGQDIVVWVIRDITERRNTEDAVASALAKAKAASGRTQRIGRVGDYAVDLQTDERHWSDEVFRLLGRDPQDGIPQDSPPYKAFFSKNDLDDMDCTALKAITTGLSQGGDYKVLRSDGEECWVHQEVVAEFDEGGTPVRLLGTLHDISDRKRTEHLLHEQARIDGLTGLPNRNAASDALATAIATAQRTESPSAILFIDVDHFKSINDSLGHAAGDDLLREVSVRLRTCLRATDFVGRMGGDEFVAILNDIKDPGRVAIVAETIKASLARPTSLGPDIIVTASIGIALYPQDGTNVEELITNADTAMYHGKREGRATHRFFSIAMQTAAQNQLRLDTMLRTSIARNEFIISYQPIVSSRGEIVAAEALVRWPHGDGSILSPSEFMPYAEESGLIVPLGTWILRTACEENARWNAATNSALRINVNVSAKQVAEPSFVPMVLDAVVASKMSPRLLEIELTETAVAQSPERTSNVVRELRDAGIRVALDDFGTGYNSLVNLRYLHVDALKLEKCFVDEIVDNQVDRAIAAAVVSAARSLGATAVAEGVETPDQGVVLRQLGFDEFQGYHYGFPMSAEALQTLLTKSRPVAA